MERTYSQENPANPAAMVGVYRVSSKEAAYNAAAMANRVPAPPLFEPTVAETAESDPIESNHAT